MWLKIVLIFLYNFVMHDGWLLQFFERMFDMMIFIICGRVKVIGGELSFDHYLGNICHNQRHWIPYFILNNFLTWDEGLNLPKVAGNLMGRQVSYAAGLCLSNNSRLKKGIKLSKSYRNKSKNIRKWLNDYKI